MRGNGVEERGGEKNNKILEVVKRTKEDKEQSDRQPQGESTQAEELQPQRESTRIGCNL